MPMMMPVTQKPFLCVSTTYRRFPTLYFWLTFEDPGSSHGFPPYKNVFLFFFFSRLPSFFFLPSHSLFLAASVLLDSIETPYYSHRRLFGLFLSSLCRLDHFHFYEKEEKKQKKINAALVRQQ